MRISRKAAPVSGASAFFAALAASALLASCSDESSPRPRLESQLTENVGVFDTLEIAFNVEVEPLLGSKVEIRPKARWAMGPKNKSILVWGADSWPEGSSDTVFSAFRADTSYSVTIEDLVSADGKAASGEQVHEFRVARMPDSDYAAGADESNGNWANAELLFRDGAFPGGDALATPQTYSGMLAGNFVSDWDSAAPDLADWYAFDFTGEQDRVEFRLESARAQELAMTFYGPRPAGPDSASKFTEWPQEASVWNKKAKCQQLSVEIDSRRHYSGLDGKDTKDTPVRYWLRVTHKNVAVDGNPAIPYALVVGEAL